MTIMGLFKQHGLDLARTVGPDGKLQFAMNGATSAPAGLAVSPVTFHGGQPEVDSGANDGMWWHEEALLAREREAMARWFPRFINCTPEGSDTPPVWGGLIDTGKRTFDVFIRARRDQGLPFVTPTARLRGRQTGRQLIEPPHMYINGNLCIASESDWDPSLHTAATVVAWAAQWLAFYQEWFFTGRWPSEGYSPRVA